MPFIVFEGLDGSGKSSLMASLEQELKRQALTFIRTREPGGTPLGDEIREIILRNQGMAPTARTELLLYEASRAQHVDLVIVPALQHGAWVLCDRFSASSIAFQAGGRQISEDWVARLNEFATSGLEPDLTVLLDLSVEESKRRRFQREQAVGVGPDRMESETDIFHERVRQAFLDQSKKAPERWLVLDASKTTTELQRMLLEHIRRLTWLKTM